MILYMVNNHIKDEQAFPELCVTTREFRDHWEERCRPRKDAIIVLQATKSWRILKLDVLERLLPGLYPKRFDESCDGGFETFSIVYNLVHHGKEWKVTLSQTVVENLELDKFMKVQLIS